MEVTVSLMYSTSPSVGGLIPTRVDGMALDKLCGSKVRESEAVIVIAEAADGKTFACNSPLPCEQL